MSVIGAEGVSSLAKERGSLLEAMAFMWVSLVSDTMCFGVTASWTFCCTSGDNNSNSWCNSMTKEVCME